MSRRRRGSPRTGCSSRQKLLITLTTGPKAHGSRPAHCSSSRLCEISMAPTIDACGNDAWQTARRERDHQKRNRRHQKRSRRHQKRSRRQQQQQRKVPASHLVGHAGHGREKRLLRFVRGRLGARVQRVPAGTHAEVAVLDALVPVQHGPRELPAAQSDATGHLAGRGKAMEGDRSE